MTTGNTTLLGLGLPVEGELDGTWGDIVNDTITSLLDSAVAGTTTLSADADVTLTTTALVANQARQAIILWTASNGATTRNITAPARSKAYIVINAGTGSVVLRGAGPTTGVTIVSGERCLVGWNGSDFVKVASTAISNLTGILPVANGGSGTATPALVQGSGVTITGTWPNQTIAATGSGGTITSVTASSPLASSGGTTPNISFTGTLATGNGGTGNANGTVAKLATTNFTIEESGGTLLFKYGATTIASMDSSGNLTTLANVTAYGTP